MNLAEQEAFMSAANSLNAFLNLEHVPGVEFQVEVTPDGCTLHLFNTGNTGLHDNKLLESSGGKIVYPEGAPEGHITKQIAWAFSEPEIVATLQICKALAEQHRLSCLDLNSVQIKEPLKAL